MSLKDIGKKLAIASSSGAKSLLDTYSKDIVEIHRQINSAQGLKADLKVPASEGFYDFIRFSSFAYDHTTVSLIWGAEKLASSPNIAAANIEVSVPEDVRKSLATYHSGKVALMPVTMIDYDGEETDKLLKLLCPLMESGRVLVRPQRNLAIFGIEDGNNSMVPVDELSPLDQWQVPNDTSGPDAVPVVQGHPTESFEQDLFRVVFPFLTGLSFNNLAMVLDDEHHHLAEARASLRKMMDEAKSSPQEYSRIADDVLRPELDKLSRRLQVLSDSQALRRAGAFFAITTLSFAATLTGGPVAGMAAASVPFGLLAKAEADHIEKEAEVKDNPHYFLWRCRKISQQSSKSGDGI